MDAVTPTELKQMSQELLDTMLASAAKEMPGVNDPLHALQVVASALTTGALATDETIESDLSVFTPEGKVLADGQGFYLGFMVSIIVRMLIEALAANTIDLTPIRDGTIDLQRILQDLEAGLKHEVH